MASLRDVADRAGVSLATASRVASGSSAVRPETRERVEAAMRDLLYVPPGRNEESSAIGLFVPEFSNPVFSALAEAMEMHAARSGLATILCNTHGSAGRERDYVRMLLERGVEGMVFISAEITDVRGRHAHYAKLLERGARLVFVNGGSEELDVTSVGVVHVRRRVVPRAPGDEDRSLVVGAVGPTEERRRPLHHPAMTRVCAGRRRGGSRGSARDRAAARPA